MIEFITDGNVLRRENTHVVLPITVKAGMQPNGTEEVFKYFPSLRDKVAKFQCENLNVGSFIADVYEGDISFSLLVIDYRPRPGANVNYITQALVGLSAHVRSLEGPLAIASFVEDAAISKDVITKLISGIFLDCETSLKFYLN